MTGIGQVQDSKPQPSIGRFVGIVAVFVALGPPVGALAVMPPQGLVQWIGALLAAHVLAAAVCTWIARRIFR